MNRLRNLAARTILGLTTSIGLMLSTSAWADSQTWDFENWTEGTATNLNLASFRDDTGLTYYWDYQQFYGGNPDTGGFLQLTPPQNSRALAVILPDIDNGAPVKAFRIAADLRVGNGTNTPPADGFSISYVRDNDVALSNALNVIIHPGSPPWQPPIGLLMGFAGGDSDDVATSPAGSTLPENGTKTGLAIVFDAYEGNRLPDTGPGGTPGPDNRGIAVRVDDHTLIQVPMDILHTNCSEALSMQTGPYDGSGAYTNLSWCRLEVEKTADNKVTVIWKGLKILDNYQITFPYTPHRGRLILAGRTGGLNQNVHFDNVVLTTTPAIEATFEGLSLLPTFKGWTFILKDTGASKVSTITKVLWNGADVTSLVTTNRTGDVTLGTYTQAVLLPQGSTNHVEVTFTTELSQTLVGIGDATVPQYFTMPVAYALPLSSVAGQQRGIAVSPWQTFAPNSNSQGNNRLNWTEEQILGLHGTNLVSGTWPTFTDMLDYQNTIFDAGAARGNFQVNGSTLVPPLWDGPDYSVSDLGFGSLAQKANGDDSTIEWFAYVHFPAPGIYSMAVNCDDGFRLTTARNAKDRMGQVVSIREGDGGAGTGLGAGVVRRIAIEQAGIYPLRGLIENRGGGFSVEWYTIENAQPVLVNSAVAGALEAYQGATGFGAYVQSAIPVRNAVDVLPNQQIRIELANGTTANVNPGSVVLKVDSNTVTPNVTGTAPVLVTLNPIGSYDVWAVGNHTIELSFADSANTPYSYTWTFTVTPYQLYQGQYGAGGTWNLYMAVRGPKTWLEASKAAGTLVEPLTGLNKVGHLVTIHSAAEANFVRMIAAGQSVWIGLTDDEAFGGIETGSTPATSSQVPPGQGQFVWVTGEPYTFARWNTGEPNDWENGSPGEDGIEMTDNGNFNDNGDGWGGEPNPTRHYVVEFETLLANKLPGVPSSLLPAEPLPGPLGCDGQFGIRVYRNAGGMPHLSAAVNAFSNPAATFLDTTSPFVNFNDLDGERGGGGIFGNELPIPGNLVGQDNDFVVVAKAKITIAESGDYTFGVHSDDGFALRIRGQTWKSVAGGGEIDPNDPGTLVFQYGTGDANTRGVITLAAGEYQLEFIWFEGGGGCYAELYAAKGAFSCDSQSKMWRLVGYQPANPPAMLPDVGVSAAGWTVEYDPSGGTALNSIANAEAALAAGASSVSGVQSLNYRDPDDQGGAQACSIAFPSDTVGVANDDFAIRATGQLVIPLPGVYHFGFAGDDGGYLEIVGQSFTNIVETADANGKIVNGRLEFNANTGNSRTVGAIYLTPGNYTIRTLFWERGGGAWWWVFGGQPGALGLLTANGGPAVPDSGVPIAPCVARPSLAITPTPTGVQITFTGKLESAPAPAGPWTEVTGATSPYPTAAAGQQMYFRAKF